MITGNRHIVDHRGDRIGAVPPAVYVLHAVSQPGNGERLVLEFTDLRLTLLGIERRIVIAVKTTLTGIRVCAVPLLQPANYLRGSSLGIFHSRSASYHETQPDPKSGDCAGRSQARWPPRGRRSPACGQACPVRGRPASASSPAAASAGGRRPHASVTSSASRSTSTCSSRSSTSG